MFWPWRWWRHVDNDPTISVASRACFLLLDWRLWGGGAQHRYSYKVQGARVAHHTITCLPARLTYDIFSQHYYTATTSPIRRFLQGGGASRCILQIVVLRRPSSCPDVACSLVSTYDFARLCSATYFRNSSSAFIPSFPELQACTSSACFMNTLAQDSRDSLKQPHSLNICWYPGQVEFKILLGHSPH